jgi:hypothetical protein
MMILKRKSLLWILDYLRKREREREGKGKGKGNYIKRA